MIYTLDPKQESERERGREIERKREREGGREEGRERERERGRQIEVNGRGENDRDKKLLEKRGEQKVLTLSTSSQGVENCLNSEMGRRRGRRTLQRGIRTRKT